MTAIVRRLGALVLVLIVGANAVAHEWCFTSCQETTAAAAPSCHETPTASARLEPPASACPFKHDAKLASATPADPPSRSRLETSSVAAVVVYVSGERLVRADAGAPANISPPLDSLRFAIGTALRI